MFQLPRFLRKHKVKHFIRPSKADKLFVVDGMIDAMEKLKTKEAYTYTVLVTNQSNFPLAYTCNLAGQMFGPDWRKWLGSVWVKCLGEPDGDMLWGKDKWAKFTGVDTNSHDLRIIALKRVRELIKSGELS